MNRREFLEATTAALLVAGCGGGGSDSRPSEHPVLRISDEEVYAADATRNVFRAHRTANTVSRLGAGGTPLWTVGSRGIGPLQFDHPVSLTADARGRLLVLDRGNGRVQVLDAATGQYRGTFGDVGTGVGHFNLARDIIASADRIYVVDQLDQCVESFDYDFNPRGVIGSFGTRPSEFNVPRGLAVGSNGDVYVSDTGSRQIKRYRPDGTYVGNVDGGYLYHPKGIAIDAAGEMWVADGSTGRVVVLTLDGALVKTIDITLANGKPGAPHDVAVVGADIYVRAIPNG